MGGGGGRRGWTLRFPAVPGGSWRSGVRKLIGVAGTVAGFAVLCPAASAFTAPGYAVRPMELPAAGPHAAGSEPSTWLIGTRPGGKVSKVASQFGARQLRLEGTYLLPRERANGFAAALRRRGELVYAEPDVELVHNSAPDAAPAAWARGAVVAPTVAPPAPRVTVGVVDDFIDTTLPDLAAQTRVLNGPGAVTGSHGTEVASAISAAANGTGVIGIFPAVPLVNYGLPADITCSAAANGIIAVVNAKATVVNLSFGSSSQCATLFRVVEAAYGAGTLVVAAAGNEFERGNAPSFPAAWPHVLSVAALTQTLAPASFSSRNAAVDVAAPGEAVPLDTPVALDA